MFSRLVCRRSLSPSLHHRPCKSSTAAAWRRCMATTPEDGRQENENEKPSSSMLPHQQVKSLADSTARGIGQVLFLNSPASGGVILVGLAVGNPYLASLAALGAVTATATAKAAGLNEKALQDGLWGYNGCLVGCAAAVFGPSAIVAATTSTLVGAAATPFVTASLKESMSIPQWTFAFNIVALTSLLRTQPLLVPVPTTDDSATSTTEVVATASTTSFGDLFLSPLTGISQIFVVESALSGAIITYGIGMYSPGLAGHAVMGSAVGTLVGAVLGAPGSELAMGVWGFNSALTSMAVGVFFVHSTPALALSAGGAAATAAVFGAMTTVFGAYGAPCLTLPFCTTMSACYLLRNQIPGLDLAKDPLSPETNTAA